MFSLFCQLIAYKIPLWFVENLPEKSSVSILFYVLEIVQDNEMLDVL